MFIKTFRSYRNSEEDVTGISKKAFPPPGAIRQSKCLHSRNNSQCWWWQTKQITNYKLKLIYVYFITFSESPLFMIFLLSNCISYMLYILYIIPRHITSYNIIDFILSVPQLMRNKLFSLLFFLISISSSTSSSTVNSILSRCLLHWIEINELNSWGT